MNLPTPIKTIQRESYRRRRFSCLGCTVIALVAAVLIGVLAVVVVLPLLPHLGLQFLGFENAGQTDDVFVGAPAVPVIEFQEQSVQQQTSNSDTTSTTTTTPTTDQTGNSSVPDAPAAPAAPPPLVIDAGSYGTFNLNPDVAKLSVGTTVQGVRLATTTLNEQELLDLCLQRSVICGTGDGQIRNARIDLRPGGAVIDAEFFVQSVSIWQAAGVVLKFEGSRPQFIVVGLDLNGTLYTVPPGELSGAVTRVEETGNDLLRQAAVEIDDERFALSEVYADDQVVTIILK